MIAIRRFDGGKFSVNMLPLPEDADNGTAQIKDFLERLGAGEIDLAGVYLRLANGDLAVVPEIARAMQIKGIETS